MFHPKANVLRCGDCKSGTFELPRTANGRARCLGCGAHVDVHEGVVELAADFVPSRTVSQAVMEWSPVVRIYESRLWRRSLLASLLTGLSFADEQALIIEALALSGSHRVLDLACGSGIYSREIARVIPQGLVFGMDISPAMLAYAVGQARAENVENLVIVHGDAMNLPFANGALDAVNCSAALHLFPDASRALSEISRVLRPGGRFTAAVARRGEGLAADAAVAVAEAAGLASWTEEDFVRRLRSAGFEELRCHHARQSWMIWSATNGHHHA